MSFPPKSNLVAAIEVYIVNLSQDEPYLGSLRDGETVNECGYFVRTGNRTVYPRANRSLVIRVVTEDGLEGWGETYGLVAPRATAEIISDLLTGFIIGRDPMDREMLHDELYNLMRVRGYTGGFYLDALAGIDIALWDLPASKPEIQSPNYLAEFATGPFLRTYQDFRKTRSALDVTWQFRGSSADSTHSSSRCRLLMKAPSRNWKRCENVLVRMPASRLTFIGRIPKPKQSTLPASLLRIARGFSKLHCPPRTSRT